MFKFAPRSVPESEKDNFKNINRILDRKIVLLIKNKDDWEFPLIEWTNGESLRQVFIRNLIHLISMKMFLLFIYRRQNVL